MKRLLLFEIIIILFLAATFESDSPSGWYQQTIALGNKTITDIQFIDSLNGWIITNWGPAFDTAYVFKTSSGGTNWDFQYKYHVSFTAINMLDSNTGYAAGGTGFGRLFKTINGGTNWNLIYTAGQIFKDVFFVNSDTGWVCDDDRTFGAGLLKTTNGGVSWIQQLNRSYAPNKLYMLNKDTGWVNCDGVINQGTYRTTNAGVNWIPFGIGFSDLCFFNALTGVKVAGAFFKTTDGGINWIQTSTLSGSELSFGSDSVGWAGYNLIYIPKTTDKGASWFLQTTNESIPSVCAIDNQNAWAGGNKLMHTTDGGGPPVGIIYASSEVSNYILDQNFPNPFNPTTIIFFKLQEKSTVELLVYNILGEEVAVMVDDDHFTAGVYQFGFDASKYNLTSGVYFYRLTAKSEVSDNVFVDTKKMVLIK